MWFHEEAGEPLVPVSRRKTLEEGSRLRYASDWKARRQLEKFQGSSGSWKSGKQVGSRSNVKNMKGKFYLSSDNAMWLETHYC